MAYTEVDIYLFIVGHQIKYDDKIVGRMSLSLVFI